MAPAGSAAPRAPLVSAITSFLNGERFLTEAIASVLDQTYESWELLLVDDGSGPAATAIAMGYAQRYPDRIRYVSHEGHRNLGTSASRNVALAAARGEYITFLDADDVWERTKLADQVALIERHPDVGMLYGNTRYWHSWTGLPGDADRDYYPPLGIDGDVVIIPAPRLMELNLRGRVAVPCIHSLLVRTSVLRRLGGFENQFTGMFDDQVMYAKLLLDGPVLVTNRSWERYRIHDESCCAVARREGRTLGARQHYLEWLERYMPNAPAADRGVRLALRRALWSYRHPRLSSLVRRAASAADRVRRRVGRADGR